MKNKIIAMMICVLLIIGVLPISSYAVKNTEDIVILYENDVHCEIDGYSKLAAMKAELQESYVHVGVVSGGDYIQGNSFGIVSRGEYIVNIMNLVGYDAVALGNHEFDYRLERLETLIGMMSTEPICSNFQKVGEDTPYFKPYSIVSYGDVDIAYIGITTPSTLTTSSPAQFKDENGNFLYTFNASNLYEVVQKNIDAAKAEGADFVIAISHVGYAEDEIYGDLEDIENLIENTQGFDVVLDAHSHSVIESKTLVDKGGNEVLLSSTGTKFEYIGKLTISGDEIQTELIKTKDYNATHPDVDAYIAQIYAEYLTLADRKVAFSEVNLIVQDENGNRLVRKSETNLGDLCADAFRYAVNADIGYVNGGGIRANIPQGDITLNQLLNVLPFNNSILLAEVSGQTIKDMMEMALSEWPMESGSFPHLSGITFSVNTAIPSSVVLDEYGAFLSVSGEYRVYDVKIYNKETEKYEPIDLNGTYTIAASNYYLLEYGSGMKMLESSKIIQNDGILDVETLERYINEKLGGTVGQEYAEMRANITFTEGVFTPSDDVLDPTDDVLNPTDDDADLTVWFICIGAVAGCVFVAVSVVWVVKITKKKQRSI